MSPLCWHLVCSFLPTPPHHLVSYHSSNPFLFQTVALSPLLLFYCHFNRVWKEEEINVCGQLVLLKQNVFFLGTRIRSTELGELQSILVLTKRQHWFLEPHAGSVSCRWLHGSASSALSNWNSHHPFSQF